MESFSRDPVPVDGCQPRTTAVAVADFLGGLNEGQVPSNTGRSVRKPPPAAMGRVLPPSAANSLPETCRSSWTAIQLTFV